MTYRFISLRRDADDRNDIITLIARPNWLARLFGAKERQVQFIGYCTVWRTFPGFQSQGTMMERMLNDIWTRENYWSGAKE